MSVKYFIVAVNNKNDAQKVLESAKNIWIKNPKETCEKLSFIKNHYIKNNDFPVDLRIKDNFTDLEFLPYEGSTTEYVGRKTLSQVLNQIP